MRKRENFAKSRLNFCVRARARVSVRERLPVCLFRRLIMVLVLMVRRSRSFITIPRAIPAETCMRPLRLASSSLGTPSALNSSFTERPRATWIPSAKMDWTRQSGVARRMVSAPDSLALDVLHLTTPNVSRRGGILRGLRARLARVLQGGQQDAHLCGPNGR